MSRRLYRVRAAASVARLIQHLHPQLKRKVRAALEQIAEDPLSGKPLKDQLAGLWSFRIGKFRVIYRFSAGQPIELVTVGRRSTIYEETYRLIAREDR